MGESEIRFKCALWFYRGTDCLGIVGNYGYSGILCTQFKSIGHWGAGNGWWRAITSTLSQKENCEASE